MLRFVARRILMAVPTLIGVSLVIFLTLKLIPGDPVATLLGPTATPQTRAALVQRLGLDQPLPVQYVAWLGSALRGDLGNSIARQVPVAPMVIDAFKNTLLLALASMVVATVGGLILGGIGALRPNDSLGKISSILSVLTVSTPQYSIALVLLIVLSVSYPLLPSSGMYDAVGSGGVDDLLRHIAMPAVAAALAPMGITARMFRASLLEVMGQDFIESLRERGLSELAVIRHAIHNTFPPLLTITGLQLGYLLGGVVFVETIFSWPGVGQLVFDSIARRDLPVIQAGVLVSALAFVLVNVFVDTSHALIDPRVRQ
jgi:peptide/nickel transport system permease protein